MPRLRQGARVKPERDGGVCGLALRGKVLRKHRALRLLVELRLKGVRGLKLQGANDGGPGVHVFDEPRDMGVIAEPLFAENEAG